MIIKPVPSTRKPVSVGARRWASARIFGTLVYATCSILPEENSQQIAAFLAVPYEMNFHILLVSACHIKRSIIGNTLVFAENKCTVCRTHQTIRTQPPRSERPG